MDELMAAVAKLSQSRKASEKKKQQAILQV